MRGERNNYYSRLLWEVECGLGPKHGEDVDEKVDVGHEENEDVETGNHKKTAQRGCGCQTG